MKIFVFEHVCGGGWTESDWPASLAEEGGAMLRALCEDMSRLEDATVTTLLDRRCELRLPDAVHVLPADRHSGPEGQFASLAAAADVAVIIAPELDDILTARVTAARRAGANVLAPPVEVIQLCSDKLRLAQLLVEHGISTLPTAALSEAPSLPLEQKAVLKPRFGAGSHDIVTVDSSSVHAYAASDDTLATSQRIVQPFVDGDAFSIGALCRCPPDRPVATGDILHLARQVLSPDGRFQFLAGALPAWSPAIDQMTLMVDACRSLLPQLAGYIGFDFVVPRDAPENPLLVEINPRLCTSYLGYRAKTKENLAGRMLGIGAGAKLLWEPRTVTYFPNGDVRAWDSQAERCV